MTAERGYKHIKVTPPEEQEVVIHAGMGSGAQEVVETQREEPGELPPPSGQEDGRSVDTAVESKARMAKDAHHATTLQDIEDSKMPRMQVTIIVVAVVAIVAFAGWYAFFS